MARAEEILVAPPSDRFADLAGVVHGGGGRARRSGAELAQSLAAKRSG